jgi:hypothetical protein
LQVINRLALRRPRFHSLDNGLRVNLLLHVDRHRRHFERVSVLFVLALPNELRIERAVTLDDEQLRTGIEDESGRFACRNQL